MGRGRSGSPVTHRQIQRLGGQGGHTPPSPDGRRRDGNAGGTHRVTVGGRGGGAGAWRVPAQVHGVPAGYAPNAGGNSSGGSFRLTLRLPAKVSRVAPVNGAVASTAACHRWHSGPDKRRTEEVRWSPSRCSELLESTAGARASGWGARPSLRGSSSPSHGGVPYPRWGSYQIRHLGNGSLARGQLDATNDPDEPGESSLPGPLHGALKPRWGSGKRGRALAIHWGGPGGQRFWMVAHRPPGDGHQVHRGELAQHYRSLDESTGASKQGDGGRRPHVLHRAGAGPKWRPMAVFFAITLAFTASSPGTAFRPTRWEHHAGDSGWPPGIHRPHARLLVGTVIIGGDQPHRSGHGILAPPWRWCTWRGPHGAHLQCGSHTSSLAPGLLRAFSPSAGVGRRRHGSSSWVTMMWGWPPRAFSQRVAGQGSAPIAHRGRPRPTKPVSERRRASLEPSIDTSSSCNHDGAGDPFSTRPPGDDRLPQPGLLQRRAVQLGGGAEDGFHCPRSGPHPHLRRFVVQGGVPPPWAPGMCGWPGRIVAGGSFFTARPRPSPSRDILPGRERGGGSLPDRSSRCSMARAPAERSLPLRWLGLASGAFRSAGGLGHYIVLLSCSSFGISTAIAWSYYGDRWRLLPLRRRKAVLSLQADSSWSCTSWGRCCRLPWPGPWVDAALGAGDPPQPASALIPRSAPKVGMLSRSYFPRLG